MGEQLESRSTVIGGLRWRLAANQFLRRIARDGGPAEQQAAHVMRSSPDMFDDFLAGLGGFHGALALGADQSTPVLDWLTKVGQWMWEHREEIMRFVIEIIKMFGV